MGRISRLLFIGIFFAAVATVLASGFLRVNERARASRIQSAMSMIASFETALDQFKIDTGTYPESLDALIQKPAGKTGENWKGPYVKYNGGRVPRDPWRNEFRFKVPGAHNKNGYDLWSAGPDGKFDTEDDIVNWKDKARQPNRRQEPSLIWKPKVKE